MKVTARLAADGMISSVDVKRSGELSKLVAECVSVRTKAATFAPPEGGSAKLVWTVQFTP